MAVPEQVRRQTEAVQSLYNDLNVPGDQASQTSEAIPGQEVISETPVVAGSASEVAPVAAAVEQAPVVQTENDWQQKYLTLQGMYNADVPRLQTQNQEMAGRLGSMEQLIATMQTASAPESKAAAPVSLLTETEVDEYGESIGIMRKVSQEIAAPYEQQIADLTATVEQMRGQLVPRVEQIAAGQAQSAEQTFWATLTTMVPNWKEINDNAEFQAWLLQTDPLTGMTRQAYLDDAHQLLDIQRVANFFLAWSRVSGATVAQSTPTDPKSLLAKQVVPGKSRGIGTLTDQPKRTYTPAQIASFFEDVRKGVYKGKEEDRNALERDIFAAQAEGRIVQT
jgi:hypothetical protein